MRPLIDRAGCLLLCLAFTGCMPVSSGNPHPDKDPPKSLDQDSARADYEALPITIVEAELVCSRYSSEVIGVFQATIECQLKDPEGNALIPAGLVDEIRISHREAADDVTLDVVTDMESTRVIRIHIWSDDPEKTRDTVRGLELSITIIRGGESEAVTIDTSGDAEEPDPANDGADATPDGARPDGPGGMSLWLDADDPSSLSTGECGVEQMPVREDADQVGCWRDKSGNGHDVQARVDGRAAWRTGRINGRPALLFDGSSAYFGSMPWFRGNQAHTIFVVFRAGERKGGQDIMGIGNVPRPNRYLHLVQRRGGRIGYGFYQNDINYKGPAPGVVCLAGFSYDGKGSGAGHRAFRVNGIAREEESIQGDLTGKLDLHENPVLAIGSRADGTHSLRAGIAEIIVYNRRLNTAERRILENYLQVKWMDPVLE